MSSGRRIVFYVVCALAAFVAGSVGLAQCLHSDVTLRARRAKAAGDTRAIVSAAERYVAHCGGLPAGDGDAACATTQPGGGPMPSGGPIEVPRALLRAQVNREGRREGPFLVSVPSLPPGWTGVGKSYAFYVRAGGGVLVCARGDGGAINSEGGTTCP